MDVINYIEWQYWKQGFVSTVRLLKNNQSLRGVLIMQLKEIIAKRGYTQEHLVSVLLDYQRTKDESYLSEKDLDMIAEEMDISKARIYSVMKFYSLLSDKPRGKNIVQVCNDVPCYVNGSTNVISELEKLLGVSVGETTEDKLFTLEQTSCIGCCDKAPAMKIGDKMFGNLTPSEISKIIMKYRRKADEK